MKVCIVSSCGGHLTEVRALNPAYARYAHFYVLNDKALLPADMEGKTYFIAHSERDWRFFLNLWEAFRSFLREHPQGIMSTRRVGGVFRFGWTFYIVEAIGALAMYLRLCYGLVVKKWMGMSIRRCKQCNTDIGFRIHSSSCMQYLRGV